MNEAEPLAAVQYLPQATVVTVVSPYLMDECEVARLRETVDPLSVEHPGGVLIIDFSEVRGLCSSAIGYLVALKRRKDEMKGRLIICCVENKVKNTSADKFVYEIFKVVKLDRYFEIHPSVDMALRHLAGPA